MNGPLTLDHLQPKRPTRISRTLRLWGALSVLALTHCASGGPGAGAGMGPNDLVAGMSGEQVDWILGDYQLTTEGAPSNVESRIYSNGRTPWRCEFEDGVLVRHRPAD